MCEPSEEDDAADDEDDDDEANDEESSRPSVCACQTLDQLAINLPPGKFLPHLLKCVQAAMASNEPHQVKAAYHAMAVCVEGCSEYIKQHHLNEFLVSISNGIKSNCRVIILARVIHLKTIFTLSLPVQMPSTLRTHHDSWECFITTIERLSWTIEKRQMRHKNP